jgi:dihydroceramide fatty acyl 2-hydroxylase
MTCSSWLSRRFSHPWMPLALFGPLAVLLSYLSDHFHHRTALDVGAWIVAGLFAWTLVEYGLHRFVFHWTELHEPWKTIASGMHMEHHAHTMQGDLIVAPPASCLILATLFYFLFALMTWSFSAAALIESGLFVGFIAYEWVHYGAHRFLPKSALGKYLRKYHLQHHHKDPDRQFGVTTPIWDIVFRTY